MKSIINEIYYGNVSGYDLVIPKKGADTELKFYEELNNSLSNEDKELFDKFINEMSDRYAQEKCECYKLGFKTGFKLAYEIAEKEELLLS